MRKSLPVIQTHDAPPPDTFDASRELPKLHEANLDWEAVDCVLADLDDFVHCIEIQGRDAAGQSVAFEDIVAARDSLVSGTSLALQILYTFADQVWVDTLLRNPSGARLLRMADATRDGTSRSTPTA